MAVAHTKTSWRDTLHAAWSTLSTPDSLAIASIAPSLTRLLEHLARQLWPDIPIYHAVSEAETCGVRNAYTDPRRLGVDRWMALIAARQLTTHPVCVVDCGSAVTIDVLDDKGQHLGGVIVPGLTMMRHALHRNTAQLPFTRETHPLGLGTCTAAAIHNGTLYALLGAIERIAAQQPEISQWFLTGGDARWIAPHLSISVRIYPDLVLQGLASWFTAHCSKHSSCR